MFLAVNKYIRILLVNSGNDHIITFLLCGSNQASPGSTGPCGLFVVESLMHAYLRCAYVTYKDLRDLEFPGKCSISQYSFQCMVNRCYRVCQCTSIQCAVCMYMHAYVYACTPCRVHASLA